MGQQELITRHASQTWESLYVALSNENINYGVDYTGFNINNSVQLLTYSLQMVNASKWRTISNLVDELTQAAQLPKDQRVRISYDGLDYRIEVPKPQQLRNTVDMTKVFDNSKGLNISLGLSAYNNKPNVISFEGDRAGHMLVSGSTRCGKTNILKIIAMLMMYKTTPNNARIALIDTVKSKGKYGALTNSAHLATEILNTKPKAVAFLKWVRDTIEKLEGRKFDKKIIIIIDEIYLLIKNKDGTENKEIRELLSYVATAGAEVGFHIIAASQYTKVDDIGGPQFKGNMTTSVTGRVKTHYDSLNATGQPGMGAENLTTPGDFLVINSNGSERIAVPEILDNYFNRIERGVSPIMTLNWDDNEITELAEMPVRAPSVGACFDKIDHRLLKVALDYRHASGPYKGKPFGADKIVEISKIMAKRGLRDEPIGNTTANEYVKFAKKLRSVK